MVNDELAAFSLLASASFLLKSKDGHISARLRAHVLPLFSRYAELAFQIFGVLRALHSAAGIADESQSVRPVR